MSDPFVHLRVASGYSLQYGASHPSELVAAAAAHEMDTLALTDRDGLYGSIRFAKACLSAGLAPIVGVDFALALPGRGDRAGGRTGGDGERGATSLAARREARPTPKPVRGGELRDPRLPRVVVYASSRAGWASLCRLTSAVHLAGERGKPVLTPELVARHADDLIVLLGSDSDLGNALATGGPDAAEWALARWREVLSPEQLAVGVTNHRLPGRGIGSAAHAGRMLSFADSHRLVGVLTNDVRMADKRRATTVDVLDAARRLVPLDLRNVDRRNAEGYLKSGKEMLAAAEEAALSAGRPDAERLFADTRTLAIRTRLDPRADIGLGEIHLPEFSALGVSGEAESAFAALRQRCEAGINSHYGTTSSAIETRLDDELRVIKTMGFASYFLTVAEVVGMIKDMGIRVAARGSGAGSLVNYLLGVSGVDPLRYGLIMERFLSPLRQALPDIDIDVESARRTEIYDRILDAFGGERVACVAMVETYRVRHAIRDVGAALSLPPGEIDAIAKSFPHIRARDARSAIRDLPELRSAGLGSRRLDVLFELVESLDGLPRHLALHPCGVLLSDATLLDRTPVEASFGGYPMSQFDKDDVEDMGLLKLDVLGIRMQSSMAHALEEIIRIEDHCPDIDALAPFDDPQVYDVIAHRNTLGCFQIESPGQRELIGKFGPSTFLDVIIDISLFRPGPVKSDMITPFLEARHGWAKVRYPHPDLEPVLRDTGGVVVFHEQIIQIVSVMTGCTLAEGDEARRALGDRIGQAEVKRWFFPAARRKGYAEPLIERVWGILESFASFGFCKAHAAAFALPTYQSAWLKTHYPAHFLAGVLTHDPGMYPKRLILEEARRCGVEILALDVNESSDAYRAIRLGEAPRESRLGGREVAWADGRREAPDGREEAWADGRGEPPDGPEEPWPDGLPDGRGYGIRLSLSDVKGITATEVGRIIAGQPYASLTDFANRTGCAAPVVERLVLAGAFDD
ncbi:MAG: DNA polymerase III subunit alpha, partial [Propionibacteriaceae bacterium]